MTLAAIPEALATNTAAKNSYKASSEGFDMEGTKKMGISAKKRRTLLSKARKAAESEASK